MNLWDDRTGVADVTTLDDVHSSPGHLIRRSQQIAVSLFAEEVGELGLTPVQFAAMVAIGAEPGIDQRSLGRIVAIDRSTIATVLKSLERRGLISRQTPETNMRVKVLHLTDEGVALLDKAAAPVAEVQRRLLAPLTSAEQKTFLRLISKLVEVNNSHSRAPLVANEDET